MADALLLFPKEVTDVLNTSFMGFKVWHLCLFALMIPSPVAFVVLFFIIPGFKEKVTELISNGIPGLYSGFSAGPREVYQGSAAGDSQNSPAP